MSTAGIREQGPFIALHHSRGVSRHPCYSIWYFFTSVSKIFSNQESRH